MVMIEGFVFKVNAHAHAYMFFSPAFSSTYTTLYCIAPPCTMGCMGRFQVADIVAFVASKEEAGDDEL
jgi:hypothetical protein